jgi:hypothetical protein
VRSWRWYSKLLFALLVSAFAYWVWPTPWRHSSLVVGEVALPVRVHRVTGRAERLTLTGWVPAGGGTHVGGPGRASASVRGGKGRGGHPLARGDYGLSAEITESRRAGYSDKEILDYLVEHPAATE